MSDILWLKDPTILFEKAKLTEILYKKQHKLERNVNSLTRLIIYISVLGYVATKQSSSILYGFIGIVLLLAIYYFIQVQKNTRKAKSLEQSVVEGFENIESHNIQEHYTLPTSNNPLMNITQNEYSDNPERKKAAPAYNKNVEEEIVYNVKSNLDSKLFRNLGDDIDFDNSMRQFHTTANTEIPNDQEGFLDFCYGNMASCKEGHELQCEKNNFRYTLR